MRKIRDIIISFNWLSTGFRPFRIFGLVLSAALLLSSASAFANKAYVIAVNEAYSFNQGAEKIQTLFNEIYAPLGIKPVIEFYPSLRGLRLVDEGRLDAEAGRTAKIGGRYANLIQVSSPVMIHHNGYFCLQPESCSALGDKTFALVSGLEAGKGFCAENKLDCLFDQSPGVLARALEYGTIEALIGSFNTATKTLCKLGSRTIYYKDIDALTITSYHFIHKKHQDLEPALAESISSLAKNGEIDRLLQNTSLLDETCSVDLIKLD
jgi:polar amino acid transport system substrate-binding protein